MKMKKNALSYLRLFNLMLLIFAFTSCAVATTYGKKPIMDPTQKDVYSFTIFKNTWVNREDMDKKVKEEIYKIMGEHGYKDYKILHVKSGRAVSKETFTVKFYHKVLE